MGRMPTMTDEDVAAAWATLHAATPPGWFVGRPVYEERRDQWSIYAFDASERPKVGSREREWVAVAPTEVRVLREMARCLNEFGAGRVPK
jgi:hypothetical protein